MVSPMYRNQNYDAYDFIMRKKVYFLDVELSSSQKIEKEKLAFERMKGSLLTNEKLIGKFIAIHDGVLTDSDNDLVALLKRLESKYGSQPILIEKLDEPLEFTSSPNFDLP